MNRTILATFLLSVALSTDAFSPIHSTQRFRLKAIFDTTPAVDAPLVEETPKEIKDTSTAPPTPKVSKAAPKNAEGIFAPAVLLTKDIVGESELNKLRAKIIGMHSDVIGKFTETAQSEFGNQVLKVLFTLADKNGDGTIDEEELKVALKALGFDFLKEKQIAGIFERADGDKNGRLDFDEWQQAAPKTLKTALIKLAKKNGHDLGFLA